MKFKFCICFALLFYIATSVYADQETLVVAGADWPGFVESNGTGVYLEPVKRAFSQTMLIKWDISQFERARQLFLAGRADILVGVYRTTYPEKLYPSRPLDIENELRAYFFSESVNIKTIADLDNKAVAWRHGYEFASLLNNYTSHLAYDEPSRAFKLLETGKIDVILDYPHNVPDHLHSKLTSIIVLPREYLWLVFQNTDRGNALLSQYEAANQ